MLQKGIKTSSVLWYVFYLKCFSKPWTALLTVCNLVTSPTTHN